MRDVDDCRFRDPNEETKLRCQNDKETLGSASSHDPSPWSVGDRLNDFVLERLLGSGSSGVVYRALDEQTNRRCALKLLKPGTPDDLLRNKLGFRRMMSLEHPNLLRVDRIYQLGSQIALSMEEVEGLTLRKAVRAVRAPDPSLQYDRLLRLLRDFASGLAAMHAHGFVHRDIKPENLMVDRWGRGRVIDYGLVDSYELDHASIAVRGFLVGTPHYFAPEVLWSQQYLPAGDIFSLGIVMLDSLRMLQQHLAGAGLSRFTGRRELDEPVSVRRCETNRRDDAERIGEAIEDLSESVPRVIRDACREMLDPRPGDRPTAMELSRLGLPAACRIVCPREEPIVGRAQETQEIRAWIDSVFDGHVGRLHLTGPSGIGKSRLVQEMINYIESKHWGQVFSARCRSREDQPLQAFDQICDAIANRYMKGDRERLQLDPVSVALLQNVFPVLKNILSCSMRIAPAETRTQRLDALEAAARMSDQLRLVGPLFVIIDDSQWADRDSLNVLDRLQTAVGREGLGVVTVSRHSDDPQRVPASRHIALQPLSMEDSVQILANAASRWSIDVHQGVLEALAQATGGTPFRLREVAGEFRPGGALAEMDPSLDPPLADLGQIEKVWQKRAQRLSDEAKMVLPLIVTAGGRVSTQQLGELTGLDDTVDAAVSELVRERLITDEATGGECIAMFHDHVADALTRTLSQQVTRQAHLAWASLLVRQDNPERLAARIAGHFFEAGQPGRAVSHAILAAEEAERVVATTEAARWYAQVIPHVEGDEKLNQLRNAARCYQEADFPLKAAEYYRQLAELVSDDERMECQLMAVSLLIRSGRFTEVRDQLLDLAKRLGLPKPKSPLPARLALVAQLARLSTLGKDALTSSIGDCQSETTAAEPPTSLRERRQRQRLRLCLSLIRPMSMFDSFYAAELSAAAVPLAIRYGDKVQQVHLAVGQAVFDCYDRGIPRSDAEARLRQLESIVAQLGSAQATGDLWSGIAYSHALACRWDQVAQAVHRSLEHYRAGSSRVFETAHTQWLDLWANWHLGQWDTMWQVSDAIQADASRRSDLFQQMMTSGGYGGGSWLARDKADELMRIRAENAKTQCDPGQIQVLQVFDWITSIQLLLYSGEYSNAWSVFQSMEPALRKAPFARMQMIRVSRDALGVLIGLHHFHQNPSRRWVRRLRAGTARLRKEANPYAGVLASLYEGLLEIELAKINTRAGAIQRARHWLLDARDQSRPARLLPYQLAAEDALAQIHTGRSLRLLADRMEDQNVARPDRLIRLYTVPQVND